MRLRSHLVLLVALAVVPVIILSVILATAFARERERGIELSTRETASALAIAVRREVDAVIASLQALAESPALDAPDLDAFRTQAERIRQQHVGWESLLLVAPSGRTLVNTAAPLEPDVSFADSPYFQAAIREGRPVVSDLLEGRISQRPVLAIAVPVERDSRTPLVLVVGFDPGALVRPLAPFDLTVGQAFRVFDRQGTTIVRFPPDPSVIGDQAGPMFAEIASGARREWVHFVARTGAALYAANVPVQEYGWLASFVLPAEQVDGAWRDSLGFMIGGGVAFLGIGMLLAVAVGRRIALPISALAAYARALGRGEPVEVAPSGIGEINEVGTAIASASRLLRERAAEQARYEEALAERARELTEANRLKDEFLATVSHELRSPLNAIVGWTRMLKLGAVSEPAARAKALETIERNAIAQERLIGDLLDVSRIVSGRLRIESRPVDLGQVAMAAADVVRPAAEAKGVRLELQLEALAQTVSGDAARLQQVLWNLLSNAVKFTPRGGLVLLRTETVNSHIRISVTDNGEGIAPEFLPHLFERFRQADAALNRAHGGLGLGLSIVRHIVELHGGTVQGESDGPGRGATFSIDLPTLAVLAAATGPAPSGSALPSSPSLEGVRVLVVEDEPDSLELIAAVLGGAGATTVQAQSAADAWTRLSMEQVDVLVCDISMPGEDGYSFVRRVRASDNRAQACLPAVALTAQARPEDRARAMLAGFQVHVPKPVEANELIAVVAALSGRVTSLHF